MTTFASRHAELRLWQRYGVATCEGDWREAVLDIVAAVLGTGRAALFCATVHGGCEEWRIVVAGHATRVVYSPRDARVITVLPW